VGTSAAAPHAAAVAALLVSRLPTISPASLQGVLASTARSMAGGTSRSVGPGLVDALGALNALTPAPPGYNGRIDGVRAVGAAETYRLMQELTKLYNATHGCALDSRNLSVCAPSEP
jgi:subtilisin family serine protease